MTEDVIYLTEDFEPVSADDPRMAMVKVRYPDGTIVFGFPAEEEEVEAEAPVQNKLFIQGGPGSGDFNHSGRPGQVGGSSSDGGHMTLQSVKDNPSALSDPVVAERHLKRIIGEWVATDGRSKDAARMLEYILPQTVPGGYFDVFHPGEVTLYRGGKGKGIRSWTTDKKVAQGYGNVTSVQITKSTPAFSIDKFLGGSGKSEYEVIYGG